MVCQFCSIAPQFNCAVLNTLLQTNNLNKMTQTTTRAAMISKQIRKCLQTKEKALNISSMKLKNSLTCQKE